jgi:hypothetical protein
VIWQNVAQTLVLMKADVSDLKRGLKDIQGMEHFVTKSLIEQTEKRNKSYDSWAKGITAVNVVMETLTKATSAAGDAFKAYEKYANEAGGAEQERARKMRSALDSLNTAFDHVAIAVGRAVAEMAPFIESLSSVVDLVGGVVEVATRIGSGVFDHGMEMKELPTQSLTGAAGEGALYAGIKTLNDSTRTLLSLLSSDARESARWADSGAKLNAWGKSLQEAQKKAGPQTFEEGAAAFAAGLLSGAMPFGTGIDRRYSGESIYQTYAKGLPSHKPDKKKGKSGGGGGEILYFVESRDGPVPVYSSEFGDGTDYGFGGFNGAIVDEPKMGTSLLNQAGLDYYTDLAAKLERGRKESIIEQVFGPPEIFDEYAAKMEMLGSVVDAFGSALQQHFDAWVQGSESASEALKGLVRDTITGIASSMMAHAIEEGALALADVARGIAGNPTAFASAAAHGKAAAAFAAGAGVVGGLARGAFGGGGAPAGAGGGAPYVTGGNYRSGGGGEQTTIYVGEGWTTTPGQQRQQTARAYRAARRELESVEGVRDA